MTEINHVAEAESYLRKLDGLDTSEAYVAVAAAQAHATLAQITSAQEIAGLQREMLATIQPPAEQLAPPADSIEEQVNPTIEEPTEFGSVVRAGIDGISDRVLWLRSASSYWFSETSRRATFSDLHEPEVLRIGVGEAVEIEQCDACESYPGQNCRNHGGRA